MLIDTGVAAYNYKIFGEAANKTAEKKGAAMDVASVDKAFEAYVDKSQDPEEIIKKITKNGMASLWAWQVENLKVKVAAQVMAEMGLTPEQIANMPPAQRMSVEQKIMEEVERRIKQIVEEGMRKKEKEEIGINSQLFESQTGLDVIQLTQGVPPDFIANSAKD